MPKKGPHPIHGRLVKSFLTGAAARGAGVATVHGFEGAEIDQTQFTGLLGRQQLIHP